MLVLLGFTLSASLLDSLNPSAIAQQMLLLTIVKNKRHTLFFICGMGLANVAAGLAIYYGVAAWASSLLSYLSDSYPLPVAVVELAAAAVCLTLGVLKIVKLKKSGSKSAGEPDALPPKSLSPTALFGLGVVFCGVEITSAAPYIGFLAFLSSCNYSFLPVLIFICIYTSVYVFPLVLIYAAYNKLRGTTAIVKLEHILGRVSAYIVPCAIVVLSVALLYLGASLLFPNK